VSAIATAPPRRSMRDRGPSRRVLVIVDGACTAPELCSRVRAYAGDNPIEALVVAPEHGSAETQWYVDEEAAHADATQRLRAWIACLARDGIRTAGQLSDPDLVQAIADALHEFHADEILIVTAPQRPSRWLRQNVIDRARRSFAQPIEHVVIPPASAATRRPPERQRR
jgi:GABA permease